MDWLTERDRQRISELVSTPKYDRRPEMLIPESDE
jgi:hypothetical protein